MIRIILLLLMPCIVSAQTITATLLPVSNTGVEICNHRFNAAATYSDNTDGVLAPSKYYAEMYAFKHNIQPTLFLNSSDRVETPDNLRAMASTKRWSFDIYYPTDRWYNPVNKVYEIIPDYYALAYTNAGVTAFGGVVLGQAKIARTPNHGQQLYDVSNGKYGYDIVTGTVGDSNFVELNTLTENLRNYFGSIFNYWPTSFSYRNGRNEGALEFNKYFVAGRNSFWSETGDSRTSYSDSLGNPIDLPLSRYDRINQSSSTRWWDMGHNAFSNAYTYQELNKTIANNGWLNNFIHYHTCSANLLDNYWHLIDTAIGSNFVWRSGMGEAMSYMWMRNAIQRVSSVVINDTLNVYVALDLSQYLDSVQNSPFPTNALRPYISLAVNLKSTYLTGKNIKSDKADILKLTDSTLILDIALDTLPINDRIYTIKVYEASDINYVNLSRPTMTSSIVTSTTIDVTSDLPTYAVLFRCNTGDPDYNSIPVGRDAILSTNHHFNITSTGDYRIGLITKYQQSSLTLIP